MVKYESFYQFSNFLTYMVQNLSNTFLTLIVGNDHPYILTMLEKPFVTSSKNFPLSM